MRHVAVLALACLVLLGPPNLLAQNTPSQASGPGARPAGPTVNLNTATAEQLEALPGIGPKVAARIIEYRQKNNGFKKIEELMNVRGIGEKTFLKMKDQLSVSGAKATPQ